MSSTKKSAPWRQRMAEAREESLIEGGEGKPGAATLDKWRRLVTLRDCFKPIGGKGCAS